MSLKIRRIRLANFRKFRAPIIVDGLADGLNIIIEPNETGKSTLLEGLRAAFFVRHATRNQLAQSYVPHGEQVGPEVEVSFEVNNQEWRVAKRFMRSPSVDVTGPGVRAQGDDAEARLQALLGFVRDTSREGDPAAWGALGLLWVGQAQALTVTAPGGLVRDTVRSALEAEVGTIMGGGPFEAIRQRVEVAYGHYLTPTGRSKDRLSDAHQGTEGARTAAAETKAQLDALDRVFGELETARAQMKVLERDLEDDCEASERRSLEDAQGVARAAAQLLATRKAEHAAARATVDALEELKRRHDAATASLQDVTAELETARTSRAALAEELQESRARAESARNNLSVAREDRQRVRDALEEGERRAAERQRHAAVTMARTRHAALVDLEAKRASLRQIAGNDISPEIMAALEGNDRAVAGARAALAAGATMVELQGDPEGVTIDDEPFAPGQRTLTKETRISLPTGTALIVRPPASAVSAETQLADALERLADALSGLGLDSLAAARERNDAAREAATELKLLAAQIEAGTPADDMIDLEAGPEALKALVAGLVNDEPEAADDERPLDTLRSGFSAAEDTVAKAEGLQESAIEALREVEARDAPLASAEAGAARGVENARASIAAIETRPEFADLDAQLRALREKAATSAVRLTEAERDATAHDIDAITRKIELIDARARGAAERRTSLLQAIARLENTVEIEGGKGLADRAAAAREDEEAAAAALFRAEEEAATLKLLRETLLDAQMEMSRTFLGPVAKRAKKHIEKLLPGCDVTLDENYSLQSITRAEVSEECDDLSKGTQEQLAILTRLAFAEMLLDEGAPVSLILDDPLVYSDDARLDVMTDILVETSKQMQVILLTCRDRAFRHIEANRITLATTS